MSSQKIKHQNVVDTIHTLVGGEYEVTSEYRRSTEPIKLKHKKCGYEYTTLFYRFKQGRRCPQCSKLKGRNSKTTADFFKEVSELTKGEYELLGEYKGALHDTTIKHRRCGTSYKIRPNSFLQGNRCPHCFKTPRYTTETYKEKINEKFGGEYEVVSEYINSDTKIDIKHNKCSQINNVRPSTFLRRGGCHHCSGLMKKDTEIFKQEVQSLVGSEYIVTSDYINSYTEISIKHNSCGKEYQVIPKAFLQGNRCPICRESKGERRIAERLDLLKIEYKRQEPIRYEKGKKPLRLDFFVQGVAIEYDGEYHYAPKPHAGGENGLNHRKRLDAVKDKYCADNGIPLIRIPYWDFDNIDEILTQKLLPLLKKRAV